MLGEQVAEERRASSAYRASANELQSNLLCRVSQAIAAAMLGVEVSRITSVTRGKAEIAHARHVAMYLAHVVFQLSAHEVALGFDRDRTSVTYGIQRIEDERDDPAFEALLSRMEALALTVREAGVAPYGR